MYFYIFLSFHFAPFLRRWTRVSTHARSGPGTKFHHSLGPPIKESRWMTWSVPQTVPRHDLSGTGIGLPIRPGVVPGGSIGRHGSPMRRAWGRFFGLSIHATRPKTVLEARDESLL